MFSILNFCDKREQSNLFVLPSEAKIISEANNFQFEIWISSIYQSNKVLLTK